MSKLEKIFNTGLEQKETYLKFKAENSKAFIDRGEEIAQMVKNFAEKIATLGIGVPYSVEKLVVDTFGLRMEEGLEELLEEFTRYKKEGDSIIFSAIGTPSKTEVLDFFSAIGDELVATKQNALAEAAPVIQEPHIPESVTEEKIKKIPKTRNQEPKELSNLKGYSAVQKHHYKALVQNNPVGVKLSLEQIKFPNELPEEKKDRFLRLLVASGLVEENFDEGIYKILKK